MKGEDDPMMPLREARERLSKLRDGLEERTLNSGEMIERIASEIAELDRVMAEWARRHPDDA